MTSSELEDLYKYLRNGGEIISHSNLHISIKNYPIIYIDESEVSIYHIIDEIAKMQRQTKMFLNRLKPHWLQNHDKEK